MLGLHECPYSLVCLHPTVPKQSLHPLCTKRIKGRHVAEYFELSLDLRYMNVQEVPEQSIISDDLLLLLLPSEVLTHVDIILKKGTPDDNISRILHTFVDPTYPESLLSRNLQRLAIKNHTIAKLSVSAVLA